MGDAGGGCAVAFLPGSQGVRGSNPLSSTHKTPVQRLFLRVLTGSSRTVDHYKSTKRCRTFVREPRRPLAACSEEQLNRCPKSPKSRRGQASLERFSREPRRGTVPSLSSSSSHWSGSMSAQITSYPARHRTPLASCNRHYELWLRLSSKAFTLVSDVPQRGIRGDGIERKLCLGEPDRSDRARCRSCHNGPAHRSSRRCS